MLIFEYCTNGDLRHYLIHNRYSLVVKHELELSKETTSSEEGSLETPTATEPITTEKLIKWAYEISAGMSYLSSKRVSVK